MCQIKFLNIIWLSSLSLWKCKWFVRFVWKDEPTPAALLLYWFCIVLFYLWFFGNTFVFALLLAGWLAGFSPLFIKQLISFNTHQVVVLCVLTAFSISNANLLYWPRKKNIKQLLFNITTFWFIACDKCVSVVEEALSHNLINQLRNFMMKAEQIYCFVVLNCLHLQLLFLLLTHKSFLRSFIDSNILL